MGRAPVGGGVGGDAVLPDGDARHLHQALVGLLPHGHPGRRAAPRPAEPGAPGRLLDEHSAVAAPLGGVGAQTPPRPLGALRPQPLALRPRRAGEGPVPARRGAHERVRLQRRPRDAVARRRPRRLRAKRHHPQPQARAPEDPLGDALRQPLQLPAEGGGGRGDQVSAGARVQQRGGASTSLGVPRLAAAAGAERRTFGAGPRSLRAPGKRRGGPPRG